MRALVSMHIYIDISAFVFLENAPLPISILLIISESDVPSSVICCPKLTPFLTCSTSSLPKVILSDGFIVALLMTIVFCFLIIYIFKKVT